jgi:hypothetical protein
MLTMIAASSMLWMMSMYGLNWAGWIVVGLGITISFAQDLQLLSLGSDMSLYIRARRQFDSTKK